MKMPKTLKGYVKVYKDFFEQDFCKDVINDISGAEWKTHKFYRVESDSYISYDNELSVTYKFTKNTQTLQDKLWHAVNQYVTKDFSSDWFNGWNGYTEVRYNKYDVNTEMKIHCDHIHSMFDGVRKGIPTLTILGALNDDYKGGEFMMWDEEFEIPAGSVIIFPSNFMYPHMVKPVTEGVRYSFVSWVW